MNRARTTYLLLLLFLMVTIVTKADPILRFTNTSVVSTSHAATSSSFFSDSNSRVNVDSRKSAAIFKTGLNLNHAAKSSGKAKKDKPDKGKRDHKPHTLPEPPMATTLAMGLALLLLKFRRNK